MAILPANFCCLSIAAACAPPWPPPTMTTSNFIESLPGIHRRFINLSRRAGALLLGQSHESRAGKVHEIVDSGLKALVLRLRLVFSPCPKPIRVRADIQHVGGNEGKCVE